MTFPRAALSLQFEGTGRQARWAVAVAVVILTILASSATALEGTEDPRPIAIVGGTVVPVTSDTISNGVVLIENGRIAAIGTADTVTIPSDARTIDARGQWVLPGLVIARSTLGLQGARGNDVDEDTGPLHPEIETFAAIDPFHPDIALVRDEGITTVNVTPGDAALVGGRGTIIKTDGTLIDNMVIKRRSCMILSLQGAWSHLPFASSPQHKDPIAAVRDLFDEARRLEIEHTRGSKNLDLSQTLRREGFAELLADRPLSKSDPRVAAILPLLRQRIPLIVRCERRQDILTALRLTERYRLRLAIHGASDGIELLPLLRKHNVAVIAGPLHPGGRESEELSRTPAGIARFVEAGVPVSLVADEDSPYRSASLRFLWLDAAALTTAGLSFEQALALLTIEPARLLGIADRVGSLEVGKDADIVLFSDHPLSTRSVPIEVFIEGRRVRGTR